MTDQPLEDREDAESDQPAEPAIEDEADGEQTLPDE